MPKKMMSAAAAAEKWDEVTPGRQRYYEANAPAAADEWARQTGASGKAYVQGISAAGIQQRYEGGVRRAGAAKYARKVADVGVARFAPGVRAAAGDYATNVAPYFEALAGLTLPPRTTRGDEANLERVRAINKALVAKRMALLGAG